MKRTLISALALTASLSLVACSSSTDTATVETAPEQGTAAATGETNEATTNPGGVNTALGGTTASGRSGVTNYSGLAGGVPPGTDADANATTITTDTTTANLTVDTTTSTTVATNSGNRVESAVGSTYPSSAEGGTGNSRTGGTNTNLNPSTSSSTVTVRTEPAVTTTTTTASIDTDNDVDVNVDDDDDDVQITTRRMVTKD
jgi:hypothetical protein